MSPVLLRQGDNTVYRVDTPQRRRFVLRLHTARRHTRRTLDAELTWLAYLSSHLPGAVPQPRPARSGQWTVEVDAGDVAPLLCSLLSWTEGTPLGEGVEFSREQAAQAGRLLAQMHRLAERFLPPPDFERPRYDAPYFRQCWLDLRQELTAGLWSQERAETLHASLEALYTHLGDWQALPGGHGLIHADAHPGNFVQQDGSLGLLDWDRCGWGPFLLDLAGVTLALDQTERDVFLAEYARVRLLPPGLALPLRALRVLAAVENLSVLARRPHERPFVLEALPNLEQIATQLSEEYMH